MNCDEAQELITALIDQELRDPERVSLENHLQQCARCRLALNQERALKIQIRAAGDHLRTPVRLRNRILSEQQGKSAGGWRSYLWPVEYIRRPAFALAIILVLALPIYYLAIAPTSQPIAYAAVENYALFVKGDLPLIKATEAGDLEEQLTRAVDGRFKPMGYDLSAMNLQPVAGAVREWQGRKVLVAIYQGEGGSLLCYTLLASDRDAPPGAARFFVADKKTNFYAFSGNGVNAVLYRAGHVTCILVSEMPMEDLLALVKAKARSH
jgi:anti-sigma factor RsiW